MSFAPERLLAIVFLLAPQVGAQRLPPWGAETEGFLRSARVVSREPLEGESEPWRLTLTDEKRRARAIWKTVDILRSGLTEFEGGGVDYNFRDSYRHEIAAYRMDRLLGLEVVPATVARHIDGDEGSLQIWIENAMTEWERTQQDLSVPDAQRWNEEMYKIRLLRQLTYDTDYANASNILIDPNWRLFAIDHSRAFRLRTQLLAESDLTRFSRSVLEKLRALSLGALEQAVGEWLTEPQMEALLERRDRIVALADRLVAERGAAAVLYP